MESQSWLGLESINPCAHWHVLQSGYPCACGSTQRQGALFGAYPPLYPYPPACHGSSTPRRHRSPNKHLLRKERYPLFHLASPLRCKLSTLSWPSPHTLNLPDYSCVTLSHNQLALHFQCPLREVVANVAARTPVKVSSSPGIYGTGSSWRKCDPWFSYPMSFHNLRLM